MRTVELLRDSGVFHGLMRNQPPIQVGMLFQENPKLTSFGSCVGVGTLSETKTGTKYPD